MKNYLVKSLFQVRDTNWHFKDRKDEDDLYNKYIEMHQLSVGSYSKHLKGDWELRFINGPVENINDAFKQTFREIYKLWKEGNTNILYTDPDTLAIKDIDPWAISDKFMMFNFTDPKLFDSPNRYGRIFPWFFNAGVRFFPANMEQRTWDIGLEMLDNWEEGTYNTEQIILNSMLWDQGLTLDQALRPEWAYQAQWLPNQVPVWFQDTWNGIDINRALIIHTHSSRDIDEKLNFMKQIASQT
jgi:hypothetical protein